MRRIHAAKAIGADAGYVVEELVLVLGLEKMWARVRVSIGNVEIQQSIIVKIWRRDGVAGRVRKGAAKSA